MELGNAMFGNSRGNVPVNRAWQNMFVEKLNEMGFDGYGCPRQHETSGSFNPTISQHLGTLYQEIKSTDGDTFYKWENEVFSIMPYYWGDNEIIEKLPNFVYKPTGFELQWYKYALRDSYMNQDITLEDLQSMMEQCKTSLGIE